MKTHPDSIFTTQRDLDNLRGSEFACDDVLCSSDASPENGITVEFVPASALTKLGSLFDRLHNLHTSLVERCGAQSVDILELQKERDELRARMSKALSGLEDADEGEMHEDTWAAVRVAIDTLKGRR